MTQLQETWLLSLYFGSNVEPVIFKLRRAIFVIHGKTKINKVSNEILKKFLTFKRKFSSVCHFPFKTKYALQ